MAKMFEKQVKALVSEKESLQNAKRVGKSNAAEQEKNTAIYESLGFENVEKGILKLYKDFQKENMFQDAENFLKIHTSFYSFDDAKNVTNNFTRIYTSSKEETTKDTSFSGETVYFKDFQPLNCYDVLRSYDSAKIYFDTQRKAYEKEQRKAEKEKREKEQKEEQKKTIISDFLNDDDTLFIALSNKYGKSLEEIRALMGK